MALLMTLDLSPLRQDSRFSRFFSAPARPAQLTLWLLESTTQAKSSLQLLYGQVVLIDGTAAAKWPNPGSSISLLRNQDHGRVLRVHEIWIRLQTTALVTLIERLLNGASLQDASSGLTSNGPPSRLRDFKLISKPEDQDRFVLRPPIFRTAREFTAGDFYIGPRKSPLSGVAPWIGSLYLLDKSSVFNSHDGSPHPDTQHFIQEAAAFVKGSCGIDFLGEDHDAIGNLDWLSEIGASPDGKELISYETDRAIQQDLDGNTAVRVHGVRVRIAPSTAFTGNELLVCCRIISGDELMSTQARLVAFENKALEVSFPSPADFTSMEVSVWSRSDEQTDFVLCYEGASNLIRELHINIDTFPGGIRSGFSGWLDKLLEKPLPPDTHERSQVLTRKMGRTVRREYMGDPWSGISKQMRRFTRSICPPVSRGRYFSKGSWKQDRANRIGEYFAELTAARDVDTLVLLDPYFDTLGVQMFGALKTSVVVLTTTGISSDDDSEKSVSRAGRIKAQWKKIAKQLPNPQLVKLWDIRFYDQKRRWKREERYLHDRMVFLFDREGFLLEALHFSNSLQAATVNFPLLVTPVPEDLLPALEHEIKCTFHEINTPKTTGWKAVLLNPVKKQDAVKSFLARRQASLATLLTRGGPFFALLLQDKTISRLRGKKLTNVLVQRGIYQPDQNAFVLEAQHLNHLPAFVTDLTTSQSVFNRHYPPLVLWLDNLRGSDNAETALVQRGGETLRSLLFSWLKSKGKAERIPPLRGEASIDWNAITVMMSTKGQASAKQLLDAQNIVTHGTRVHRFHGRETARALELLSRFGPDQLLAATEVLVAGSRTPGRTAQLNFLYCIELWTKQFAVRHAHISSGSDPTRVLLRSQLPFMRSLGVAAEFSLRKDPSKLRLLPPHEQVLALSSWIYELRVLANQKGAQETSDNAALRVTVFGQIISIWPKDASPEFLRDVVRLCSGPLEGNWAGSTYVELLEELVAAGHLSRDAIADVWMTILMEKLFPKGVGHHDNGSNRFYLQWDAELSLVSAGSLALADTPCRRKWKEKLELLVHEIEGKLRQPYLRSRSYEKWLWAAERLVWAGTLIRSSLAADGAMWEQTEIAELQNWGEPRFSSAVQGTALEDSSALGAVLKFARGEMP